MNNKDYITLYSTFAKEQMRRYGIPASVILAQAILESSNGQSQLSRECNNHFGIKATDSWLKNGGEYGVYTDDRPNEKFCKYKSVGDSYEHHSQFLSRTSDMRSASRFHLTTTRDGRRALRRLAMPLAAVMQRVCNASLKPTDWTSMTVR